MQTRTFNLSNDPVRSCWPTSVCLRAHARPRVDIARETGNANNAGNEGNCRLSGSSKRRFNAAA
eukprot:839019-Alexandrium_andersonii.AAC.1